MCLIVYARSGEFQTGTLLKETSGDKKLMWYEGRSIIANHSKEIIEAMYLTGGLHYKIALNQSS